MCDYIATHEKVNNLFSCNGGEWKIHFCKCMVSFYMRIFVKAKCKIDNKIVSTLLVLVKDA